MKRLQKIISTVLLFAFLFNICSYDLLSAANVQPSDSIDNLAVALKTSNILRSLDRGSVEYAIKSMLDDPKVKFISSENAKAKLKPGQKAAIGKKLWLRLEKRLEIDRPGEWYECWLLNGRNAHKETFYVNLTANAVATDIKVYTEAEFNAKAVIKGDNSSYVDNLKKAVAARLSVSPDIVSIAESLISIDEYEIKIKVDTKQAGSLKYRFDHFPQHYNREQLGGGPNAVLSENGEYGIVLTSLLKDGGENIDLLIAYLSLINPAKTVISVGMTQVIESEKRIYSVLLAQEILVGRGWTSVGFRVLASFNRAKSAKLLNIETPSTPLPEKPVRDSASGDLREALKLNPLRMSLVERWKGIEWEGVGMIAGVAGFILVIGVGSGIARFYEEPLPGIYPQVTSNFTHSKYKLGVERWDNSENSYTLDVVNRDGVASQYHFDVETEAITIDLKDGIAPNVFRYFDDDFVLTLDSFMSYIEDASTAEGNEISEFDLLSNVISRKCGIDLFSLTAQDGTRYVVFHDRMKGRYAVIKKPSDHSDSIQYNFLGASGKITVDPHTRHLVSSSYAKGSKDYPIIANNMLKVLTNMINECQNDIKRWALEKIETDLRNIVNDKHPGDSAVLRGESFTLSNGIAYTIPAKKPWGKDARASASGISSDEAVKNRTRLLDIVAQYFKESGTDVSFLNSLDEKRREATPLNLTVTSEVSDLLTKEQHVQALLAEIKSRGSDYFAQVAKHIKENTRSLPDASEIKRQIFNAALALTDELDLGLRNEAIATMKQALERSDSELSGWLAKSNEEAYKADTIGELIFHIWSSYYACHSDESLTLNDHYTRVALGLRSSASGKTVDATALSARNAENVEVERLLSIISCKDHMYHEYLTIRGESVICEAINELGKHIPLIAKMRDPSFVINKLLDELRNAPKEACIVEGPNWDNAATRVHSLDNKVPWRLYGILGQIAENIKNTDKRIVLISANIDLLLDVASIKDLWYAEFQGDMPGRHSLENVRQMAVTLIHHAEIKNMKQKIVILKRLVAMINKQWDPEKTLTIVETIKSYLDAVPESATVVRNELEEYLNQELLPNRLILNGLFAFNAYGGTDDDRPSADIIQNRAANILSIFRDYRILSMLKSLGINMRGRTEGFVNRHPEVEEYLERSGIGSLNVKAGKDEDFYQLCERINDNNKNGLVNTLGSLYDRLSENLSHDAVYNKIREKNFANMTGEDKYKFLAGIVETPILRRALLFSLGTTDNFNIWGNVVPNQQPTVRASASGDSADKASSAKVSLARNQVDELSTLISIMLKDDSLPDEAQDPIKKLEEAISNPSADGSCTVGMQTIADAWVALPEDLGSFEIYRSYREALAYLTNLIDRSSTKSGWLPTADRNIRRSRPDPAGYKSTDHGRAARPIPRSDKVYPKKSNRSSTSGATEEINSMTALAGKVLRDDVAIGCQLFVPQTLLNQKECDSISSRYDNVFEAVAFNGKNVAESILSQAKDKDRAIALISKETLDKNPDLLDKLKDAGIRFLITREADITDLNRLGKDKEPYLLNTFATMLIARSITSDTAADSPLYQLLRYYLQKQFDLEEGVTVEDYINAIATMDIARLIKGFLAPIKAFRGEDLVEKHHSIALTLVAA